MEEIRRAEPTSGIRTPIIALTAHADEDERRRCLDAGMDGYLAKPIDSKALMAEVDAENTREGDPPPTQMVQGNQLPRTACRQAYSALQV